MTGGTRVVLHIERIVLDGLALGPAGREQLRSALAAELAGRLGSLEPGSWLHGGGAVPAVGAAPVELGSAAPAAIASRVAASVAGALGAGGGR